MTDDEALANVGKLAFVTQTKGGTHPPKTVTIRGLNPHRGVTVEFRIGAQLHTSWTRAENLELVT